MDSFSSSAVDIKSPRSKLVNTMNELLKVHTIHSGNESYINEAFRDDSADSSIQWIFFSGKHLIYQMIFIFAFSLWLSSMIFVRFLPYCEWQTFFNNRGEIAWNTIKIHQ